MTMPMHRRVAGLDVPLALVPRIVAAFRGLHPQLTEGLDDDTAVKAVLKSFATETLVSWEGGQAARAIEEELDLIRAQHRGAPELAREEARQAAATIELAPPDDAPAVP